MKKQYLKNESEAFCGQCGSYCIPEGMIETSAYGSCETWVSHCCDADVFDIGGNLWKPEYD